MTRCLASLFICIEYFTGISLHLIDNRDFLKIVSGLIAFEKDNPSAYLASKSKRSVLYVILSYLSPQLDVDGMLREPLVPEAVRNLNLGNFDGRNLDAGHLDGGRDGGRGDRHANDKHNGQNQCKKFSHSSFLQSFYAFSTYRPIKSARAL